MNISNANDTDNAKVAVAASASHNSGSDNSSSDGNVKRRSSYVLAVDGQQHDVSNLAPTKTPQTAAAAAFRDMLLFPPPSSTSNRSSHNKKNKLYPDLKRVAATIETPDRVCHSEHDAFMEEWTEQWLTRSASLSAVVSSPTDDDTASAMHKTHLTAMPRSISAPIYRDTSLSDDATTQRTPPFPTPKGNPKRSGSSSSSENSSYGSFGTTSSTGNKVQPPKIMPGTTSTTSTSRRDDVSASGGGQQQQDSMGLSDTLHKHGPLTLRRRQLEEHQQQCYDQPAYLRADLDEHGKPMVEIGNIKVPYVGSTARTKAAICQQVEPTVALDCPNCQEALVCIAGLRYVLCVTCKTVSSAQRYHQGGAQPQSEPFGVGVGLVRPADYKSPVSRSA
ncbi:expressed unknown protein [Seminavis robusta]|uniref:Uncharacterized protein n=1 Tax=Seminavis robusta TaxID=568900 RepID=A0A9N8E7H3_9STRA|nr:expressed unknown protein [Seminavis robusta]|eukprot:Sro629_g178270.1 n/a (391) ;mRNA; r:52629-53801